MKYAISPEFAFTQNSLCLPADQTQAAFSGALTPEGFLAAKQEISSWTNYAFTPLESLDLLSDNLGVGSIYYKNEASRFGLGSFKALGGAYAVANLLKRELKNAGICDEPTYDQLVSPENKSFFSQIVITCATDGNHGRSVAWGCQRFGCQCVIYIHATVSQSRQEAIEAYGAKVVRVPGNYDDAVRQADADAKKYGRYVVSDTSYEGYTDVPKDVMQGYTVMVDEAVQQLPDGIVPTHVFIQGGVGGLAAAVAAQLWQHYGDQRPTFIVVEPTNADCLYQSAVNGKPTVVHGELDTLMAGLACGEVSILAWDILKNAVPYFARVTDQAAVDCMRLLANQSLCSYHPIEAGESAVAGLSGLILMGQDLDARQKLQLNQESHILLIGSEGATDPELYHRLVTETMETECN